ncbi:glycosyltransferase [Alteromonas flava]|uniref:glycosyltransferase n=1 Tax=Alteromonas flava TaxID=2048003 RepID=UPI0013DB1ACE|nr:glycosyltransferase [Alteromonas flava]
MKLTDFSHMVLWGANRAASFAKVICELNNLKWSIVDRSPKQRQHLFGQQPIMSADELTQLPANTLVVICADAQRFGTAIEQRAVRLGASKCIDYRTFCAVVQADLVQSENKPLAQTSRTQKVAIVVPRLAIGGAEQQAILVAEALRNAGKEVVLLALSAQDKNAPGFIEKAKLANIRYDNLSALNTPIICEDLVAQLCTHNSFYDLSLSGQHYLVELYHWVSEEQPSSVISFLDEANIICGDLTSTFIALPAILWFRSLSPPELVSKSAQMTFCVNLTTMAKRYQCYAKYAHIQLAANSLMGLVSYAKWLGFEPTQIQHIPNIVRHPADNRPIKPEINVPTIVGIMRLEQEKGPDDFVRVIEHLVQIYGPVNAVLVGAGSMHEALIAMIRAKGLESYIKLVGAVTDPNPYLLESDILVQTSHIEGLPNALLEGQSCGCMIVATDVGSSKDALADDYHKYMVAPTDIYTLANRVSSLLKLSRFEHQKLIQQGYAFIEKHYSATSTLKKVLPLIRS